VPFCYAFGMAEIRAFRGLRYDLGHVGSLSDVIAPPYDVIDPALQDALYQKHPANVIRLILNREEPGDDEVSNRYARAARFLKNWRSEGVLQTEPDPALYVYHQVFSYGDRDFTRRGFITRVRLERFGEGKVYPHEETHSGPKADRLKLTQACKANLSPIFAVYRDEDNEAQGLLEDAVATKTPLEATDHLGVVHRMWPVNDIKVIGDVTTVMAPKPMYIADGHHRYETACNYKDQLEGESPLDSQHPANFVLTTCISMNDPGMIVLPTHRLFRGMSAITSTELVDRLGDRFDTEIAGQGIEQSAKIWDSISAEGDQSVIGFFAAADQSWVVARITEAGRQRMAQQATDHSPQWQGLGVSILQRLVIEDALGMADLPKPKYVHLVEELIDALAGDHSGPSQFSLAALVMPATLAHVRTISENNERMPAKSTYFYPKLLSGLVFNPLE